MSKLETLKIVLEKWKPDAVLLGALTKQYADALAEQCTKLAQYEVFYNNTLAESTKWQEVIAALHKEVGQILSDSKCASVRSTWRPAGTGSL